MDTRARLFYDADCGFCRWTLAWVLRFDRSRRLRPFPIESAQGDSDLGDLGEARLDSWHLLRGDRRWSGGRAFAPLLEELPAGKVLAAIARRLEPILVPGYRWVAAHRAALGRLIPARSRKRADAFVEDRTRAALLDGKTDSRM
jgi:predicted DCC family thiol-disulfide oxidoreductase YuxK